MPTKPDDVTAATAGDHAGDVLMQVRDLEVHFALRGGSLARLIGRDVGSVKAVDGVSFDLHRGEVLGVVGESGSGKTTLGRTLLGLVRPTAGEVHYQGRNLAALTDRQLRPFRRRLQMVFQDPHAALNPSMDLETAVGHPLRIHGTVKSKQAARPIVADAFERVGLSPVERFLRKYPSDLSGGQKQRAVIARAVILRPELLVADEPVSMLDMSVRAKILELMLELKDDLDLTYVYITHDLATAKFFCDRVAIMYLGRIVEIGPTKQIFAEPKHPYTQALLKAIPEPDPTKPVARDLPRGEIPDAAWPPQGCSFHPRCPYAFQPCGWEPRDLRALLEHRWTRLQESEYDAERAKFADLTELEAAGHLARVRPSATATAQDLYEIFEEIRAADPQEPLWRGVSRMAVADDSLFVEFHEGVDPGLGTANGVAVACHLYDREFAALAPPGAPGRR